LFQRSFNCVLESRERGHFRGTIISISRSGLGIYSKTPLIVGDELKVKSEIPTWRQRYTVQWVNKLPDDFFMAGLYSDENVEANPDS
jgi:hypothetical protein